MSTAIGVIGCGNMGSAIVRGMVDKGIFPPGEIYLYDKISKKAEALACETGTHLGDLSQMVRGSEYLLIAVKPQDSEKLFRQIAGDIVDQTIISVMAGVSIKTIAGMIGKEVPIVRAMPNMAAFAGESITCVSLNGGVQRAEEIKKMFTGIGNVLEVEEAHMDAVTALSGSGPAYLFYLAEAMMEAGEEVGLSRDVSEKLVVHALYGAAVLLKEHGESPEELIDKVASEGGTTEAALLVFEKHGLKEIMKDAIYRARERSKELSEG